MQNFATILSNTAGFYLTSGGVTGGSSVLSDAVFSHYQYYNLAKSKWLAKYQTTDTRAGIYSTNPNFIDLYEFNFTGSTVYEYGDRMNYDTINGVFNFTYGGKDYPGFVSATGRRPASGTTYRTSARFSWFGSTATENETADTYHTQWHTGGDLLMGLKDGGKFLIGNDSTFIFDPNTDLLQISSYGKDNHVATITGDYSTRVAGLTPNGLVQDFRLTRDTFIEDVTLFSVGTLMHDCQELTIISSMTSTAPTNMEMRFPDASDLYRGRKIIVYSKKKDPGVYVPQIKVVGGVSRLYFTTNPAVGGTDPSDQSTLSIDDSVWSDHGTTFEFTCLRIDNTPSYRWVLKQR